MAACQYDETIGGGTGNVSYKNNDTVTHYLQKAAKNIIYAVTNSNAVKTYSEDVKSSARVFNWKALLWCADAIVWAGAAAVVTLFVLSLVRDKKNKGAER